MRRQTLREGRAPHRPTLLGAGHRNLSWPSCSGSVWCDAALRRRRSDVFLLILFPYLVLLMAAATRFARPRHLVMLYPVIAVFAASGFEFLWSRVTRPWPARRLARPAGPGIAPGDPVRGFPAPHDTVIETPREPPRIRGSSRSGGSRARSPAGSAILNDGGILPLRCEASPYRVRPGSVQTPRRPRGSTSRIFGSLQRQWTTELLAIDEDSAIPRRPGLGAPVAGGSH